LEPKSHKSSIKPLKRARYEHLCAFPSTLLKPDVIMFVLWSCSNL
jgi:hypothetical protein